MQKKIFLIFAGEPSGDEFGAKIMKHLQKHSENSFQFVGLGGNKMKEEGLISLEYTDNISIFGLSGIITNIFKLITIRNKIVKYINNNSNNIVAYLTIDMPDVSLWITKKITHHKFLRFHYIAPTVWFWRANRVKKIEQLYHHLFIFFPFEIKYFKNIDYTFVGHPLLDEEFQRKNDAEITSFRKEHNIPLAVPLILILPGSRKVEITNLCDTISQTVEKNS